MSVSSHSKKSLARIGAATVQSALVPLLGITFYYILSLHFSTAAFGILSWGNAVSMWLIMLISYGLEQVVLRRSAAGNDTSTWATAAFLYHVISGCVLTAMVLFGLKLAFPDGHEGLAILPILFLAQGFNLMVTPLKTLLNARERYLPYAIVSLCSNLIRISSLIYLLQRGKPVTLQDAALLLLFPFMLELAAMACFFALRIRHMNWKVRRRSYLRLLKEATPQAITVVFDIRLGGRADWILMGLLSTNAATGLYTFAARGFELLRMPISVISMLLMPKLARMMLRTRKLEARDKAKIQTIYRMQMWLAAAMVLCMNLLWGPVISLVTAGKYGYTDAIEMGILSLCLPFHFAQNLFWMLTFSAKKYRAVARITVTTSLFNIVANAALIPFFSGKGAATAFLLASALQTVLYAREQKKSLFALDHRPLWMAMTAAACAMSVAFLPIHFLLQCVLGIAIYLGLSAPLKLLRKGDVALLKSFSN